MTVNLSIRELIYIILFIASLLGGIRVGTWDKTEAVNKVIKSKDMVIVRLSELSGRCK